VAEHIYGGASDEEKASQSGNRPKLAQADELATQGKSGTALFSSFLHHRLPAARLPLLAKFVQRHHARMIASAL
jgi:hypothetical protein